MPTLLQNWPLQAVLVVTSGLSLTWHNLISKHVPQPYLDEFFHVPQGQKYCDGDYTWDPKITTPPGLYIVAKLFRPIFGCSTASLRALNVVAACLICLTSYDILRLLRARIVQDPDEPTSIQVSIRKESLRDSTTLLDANTALNVALFPPLFFFSALFYTDVMSTLVVLLSYSVLLRKRTTSGTLSENITTVSVGLLALLFRQTNIFWVAVFPGALTVVAALKADTPHAESRKTATIGEVLQHSWSSGAIHDNTVQDAAFQDYILLVITVALAALKKPFLVIRVALPYFILLGLFAGFVLWNGSVVLGDKSAHTATVHLPQMLYFWPYIAFFSAPLVMGPLLRAATRPLPRHFQALLDNNYLVPRSSGVPDVVISCLFIAGALAAVYFNTIIHPYTLADNRHYVFYIFRILRRHPAVKYLAILVYYICAWSVTNSLGMPPNDEQALKQKRKDTRPTSAGIGRPPCQSSFLTIWLVTTALSVVTAPLVEPRYFIIPWIMWRLHVQAAPASLSKEQQSNARRYDIRLGMETLWLLAIDAAIMYVFLFRGFAWPSEPGKVQRFLW